MRYSGLAGPEFKFLVRLRFGAVACLEVMLELPSSAVGRCHSLGVVLTNFDVQG